MNMFLFSQKDDPGNGHVSLEEEQESIYPDQHEVNITEGSEFMDDAIRMKEQPLGQTTVGENDNR
jgi:hypothetical protein